MTDLITERKKIVELITSMENVPIVAEYIVDCENTPREVIEKRVRESDCYIGIFHKRWGYVPSADIPSNLSVTAIEYKVARSMALPLLILVSEDEKEPELKSFLNEISSFELGAWHKKYKKTTDMIATIARVLPDLVTKAKGINKSKTQYQSALLVDPSQLLFNYDSESKRWRLSSGINDYVDLVVGSSFTKLENAIMDGMKENRISFIIGPHGIGKSFLARYIMIKKMQEKTPVLLVDKLSLLDITDCLYISRKYDGVVFFDPMGTEIYVDRDEVQGLEFNQLERNISEIIKEIIKSNCTSLVVLPTDIWNTVTPYLSTESVNTIHIDSEMKNRDFLLDIVFAYAKGCFTTSNADMIFTIIDTLLAFNGGYVLIAAYVGRLLAQNNCVLDDINNMLKIAEGKPTRFLQNYVWSAILRKQNKNQINSEADLYIRTEDFLGRNTTLEDFVQLQKAYTSSLLAVSSFNETRPIIGDKPAWQLEYTFKGIGGTIRQGINSLLINDNIGHSIVFTADKKNYEKYFPIAQKMIDSFL